MAIKNLVIAKETGRLPEGFSLNVVLHRGIISRLNQLVAHFKKLGVDDIRFNFIRPEYHAVGNPEWVPTVRQLTMKIRNLVAQNQIQYKMHLTFGDIPLCKFPWEVLLNRSLHQRYLGENLDPTTTVSSFRLEQLGGTERFEWKDQKVSFLKRFLPTCDLCIGKIKCEGIWSGYLAIYGSKEFASGPELMNNCGKAIFQDTN
jgi:MoaA/NifB/PqqE/SkfB family radical SAM enzyme